MSYDSLAAEHLQISNAVIFALNRLYLTHENWLNKYIAQPITNTLGKNAESLTFGTDKIKLELDMWFGDQVLQVFSRSCHFLAFVRDIIIIIIICMHHKGIRFGASKC